MTPEVTVSTMRADSTLGRIIEALARTSLKEVQTSAYGLDRHSRSGLLVSALAREDDLASSVISRGAATVALIESRAAARDFLRKVVIDCQPSLLDAFLRLENMPRNEAISNLRASIDQIPHQEVSAASRPTALSLKRQDLSVLMIEISQVSIQFRRQVRKLKKMIRNGDRSIYAFFIADEIVSALDTAAQQASSIRYVLIETFLYRRLKWVYSSSRNGISLATRLYDALRVFGSSVRSLAAFATSSVDAADVDLSGLGQHQRYHLVGIVWTDGTIWPRNLANQVGGWSSEIREGVFMIRKGNSEREPSVFVLT